MKEEKIIQKEKKSNLILVSVLLLLLCIVLLVVSISYKFKSKESDIAKTDEDTNVVTSKDENTNNVDNEEKYEKSILKVFVSNDLTDKEVQQLQKKINELDGVESASIYTKEDALNEMKGRLGNSVEILDGYEGENNIFPNSIIVQLNGQVQEKKIQEKIKNIKINGKVCTDKINSQEY